LENGEKKMYCPRCGTQQVNEEIRFCSRCGLPLSGIGLVVANNGELPQIYNPNNKITESPKKAGVKFGAFMVLLGCLIVPISGIITVALDLEPYLTGLAAIIFFVGGVLRMIYAALFEEGANTLQTNQPILNKTQTPLPSAQNYNALPPQPIENNPVSAYQPPIGSWRTPATGEVVPPSVTEHTTKFLDPDKQD
jgi:hypothetical protein